MLPLPGSSAICAGTLSLALDASGNPLSVDQRGVAMNPAGYCPAGAIDAGAVQSDYAFSFTQQPTANSGDAIYAGQPFTAEVDVTEDNTILTAGTATVAMALSGGSTGTLSGTTSQSTASDKARFADLTVSKAGADSLVATLALSRSGSQNAIALAVNSIGFTVSLLPTMTIAISPADTFTYSAGTAQTIPLKATVTNASAGVSSGAVSFTVSDPTGAAVCTPSAIVSSGSALASCNLAAGARAGSYSITARYSDTNGVYAPSSSTTPVNFAIGQATPSFTWATPAAITYGTALSAAQLDASSAVPGTFVYSPAAGTVPKAGSQTLTVTFTPTDAINYKATTATVTLVVNQATPTITWATPTAITYGTALSAAQLNATSLVPGSFTYSPAAGTVLDPGQQKLSAAFTPTDATDYTTATATVNLWVDNPYPLISGTSPSHVAAGAAGFTLTVNGSGFMPTSTIYWGNTGLTTSYASGTQLTAAISASQIASAGTAAITVQTGTPGGGTSNAFQFEIDSANSGSTQVTISTITATVAAGSVASYSVVIPAGMTNVSVTCLNLPTATSCAYTPGSGTVTVATGANTPKGTYSVTLVFTGEIRSATSAGWIVAPFLLIPVWLFGRRARRSRLWTAVCVLMVLTGTWAIGGCGGGSSAAGGGTTQVQVTTSGGVSLTIQ